MGFVNGLPSCQGGVGGNKAICLKASEGEVSQDLDEREWYEEFGQFVIFNL